MNINNNKFIFDVRNKILSYFNDTQTNKKNFNNLIIDGPWGSGKTTVIKEILKKIDDNKFRKIIITVWKYELFESDIILLVFMNFLDELGINDKEEPALFKKILKSLKIIGKNYFENFVEKSFKISKKSQEKIRTVWKSKKTDNFKKGSNLSKNLNAIENLIEYVNDFLVKKGEKIILVFDELDRCLDENILKILTAIKLIILKINYKNLFVICCANRDHIKQVGKNTGENYIDKIFSLKVSLKSNFEYDEKLVENKNNKLIDDFVNS